MPDFRPGSRSGTGGGDASVFSKGKLGKGEKKRRTSNNAATHRHLVGGHKLKQDVCLQKQANRRKERDWFDERYRKAVFVGLILLAMFSLGFYLWWRNL